MLNSHSRVLSLLTALTLVFTACSKKEDKQEEATDGGSSENGETSNQSNTTWYGKSIALEFQSIRTKPSDDNPSLQGLIITPDNKLLQRLDMSDSGVYAFADYTSRNVTFRKTNKNDKVRYFDYANFKEFYIEHDGYLLAASVAYDENSNGAVDAGELRARIAVYQKSDSAPYPLARPTTAYDYGAKVAGSTFTGITLLSDNTLSTDGFTINESAENNTVTLPSTVTGNITGKITHAGGVTTLGTDQNFSAIDANVDTTLLSNHGIYHGGLTGTTGKVIAVVASPDGKAIAVAMCHGAKCRGTAANGDDVEEFFNLDATDALDQMSFSILTKAASN